MKTVNWYMISNAEHIVSPALAVYPSRVSRNITKMLSIVGDQPERLCPHVKTHKNEDILTLCRSTGLTSFKCSTVAELEMAARVGANFCLLAMQPVGPAADRLSRLLSLYPDTQFATIVDNARTIEQLSSAAAAIDRSLTVLLDIDNGMGRTGICCGEESLQLYRKLGETNRLEAGGLHIYDGHIHDQEFSARRDRVESAMDEVLSFRDRLLADGLEVPRLICGGTPSFPVHAQHADRICSPGTPLLWDAGYEESFPDLEFEHAAVLVTRVVSKLADNRICVDLGYKAIAAEMAPPRVRFLNAEVVRECGHSEEHLVVETAETGHQVGDILYAIPRHICPTVARHDNMLVVEEGEVTDSWKSRRATESSRSDGRNDVMDEKRRRDALTYCEVTTDGGQRSVREPDGPAHEIEHFSIGQLVADRYLLRSELGRGGMGKVFLAHDSTLNRNVALKVELTRTGRPAATPDPAREARIAALLSHEGIASVYDFGTWADVPYTIFEYIDGRNLRQVIIERGQWTLDEVVQLVDRVASALDFAHAEGVIHSDLKPENICIGPDGAPTILDFGIARELKAEVDSVTFRGTAAYASPEQAGSRTLGGRSDQYALGLVAYELLAGRRPFEDDDPLMQLHFHEYEQPPGLADLRPELPAAVSVAVMRTLEKDPTKRFATCREFANELAHAAAPSSTLSRQHNQSDARTELHISETSSDSLVARMLADELEQRGYRTWYYQRDALPGIPLSRQVHDSLTSTRAALLLISRGSLPSVEFAEEVMAAHKLGRVCLPILVGMSLEEFESHEPIWRPALGSSAVIELDRDTMESTLERIVAAVTRLGIVPGTDSIAPAERQRSTSTQIWATDANQIEIKRDRQDRFSQRVHQ